MTPAARRADLATCHQDQQHGHASCGCLSCWVSSNPWPSDIEDATSKACKSPSRNNTSVSQPPLSPRTGKTVWEKLAWEVLAPLEALGLSASLQRSGPVSATLSSAMMSPHQAHLKEAIITLAAKITFFFLKYQGQHVLRGKYVYHTQQKLL